MDFFFKYILPISIVEIIAALVGTFYFIRRKINGPHRWVVYYLWLVIVIESYGFMVGLSKHTNYEQFGFLKDTIFQNSRWIYNILSLLTYLIFTFYFINFIHNYIIKIALKALTIVFSIISVALLFNLEILLHPNITFIRLGGTILMFVTILFFFLNLLKSDKIIDLKTYFPFYVAVGFLFFILSTTPIDIYYKYYDISNNQGYVNLRATVYLYINIFLYTTLTLGFILCFKTKKFY